MKDIKTYILEKLVNEEYEEYRVNDVTVIYKAVKDPINLQAPSEYNESNIQQYITDLWLDKLPGGGDNSVKFFGENADNIYDVYFEYDNFEHIVDTNNIDYIEFDSHASSVDITDDTKLDIFKLHHFKYIIKFEKFDLKDSDDRHIKETLSQIFKAAESNSQNKYPIELKYNESELKYTL